MFGVSDLPIIVTIFSHKSFTSFELYLSKVYNKITQFYSFIIIFFLLKHWKCIASINLVFHCCSCVNLMVVGSRFGWFFCYCIDIKPFFQGLSLFDCVNLKKIIVIFYLIETMSCTWHKCIWRCVGVQPCHLAYVGIIYISFQV